MKANAIVGQSGGPTSVINASLAGVIKGCEDEPAIGTVYGMRFGIEGFLSEMVVDLGNLDAHQLELLKHTPSSALGSCRKKLADEDLPEVLSLFRKLDIRYCFLIGGNDTMNTVERIERYCRSRGYELSGIGVPKTVDNDLFGTDHAPGYPSAARYVALSVLQSGRLARDMQRVDKFVVHQTIGRDTGWLAASSALARRGEGDPPHLIYVPERPISRDSVVRDVRKSIDEHGWVYVVVGEGTTWEDGTPVSDARAVDGFQNLEFGAMSGASAAIALHRLISEETGERGEFQVTESLPMCADDRTTSVDVGEAYGCGLKAVRLAATGTSGVMVTIDREAGTRYQASYGAIELSEVVSKARPVPDDYLAGSGTDMTEEFLDYLRPLCGPLPEYADIKLPHVRLSASGGDNE